MDNQDGIEPEGDEAVTDVEMANSPNDNSDSDPEFFDVTPETPFLQVLPTMYSGVAAMVLANDLNGLMEYVSRGQSVRVNDNSGNTPLHISILLNRTVIFKYLANLSEFEIHINDRNFYGETALFLAVKVKNLEFGKILLENGANPNISNTEDVSPLHLAATQEAFVLPLLKYNAMINVADADGYSPLADAVAENNLPVVNLLLSNDADINLGRVTPFIVALMKNNVPIQNLLVDSVQFELHPVSYLTLGIRHESPHIEKIVEGCASYPAADAFGLAINHSVTITLFKIIWKQIYKLKGSEFSRLNALILSGLSDNKVMEYLTCIVEFNEVETLVLEYNIYNDFDRFLLQYVSRKFPLDFLTKLGSLLLMNNVRFESKDVHIVYQYYKNCQLLDKMLHSEITLNREIHKDNIMLRVWFEVEKPMSEILRDVDLDAVSTTPRELFSVFHEPFKVASLLELARNATRDAIIKTHNVKTCSQYMTIVKQLDFGKYYEKLILFQLDIYPR